ncbi:MAG: hypothetical protein FWD75_07075 [Propionibacteriaceae bacterium]|nr:hypothetical protein [Propionibacteriaceae bacterium]
MAATQGASGIQGMNVQQAREMSAQIYQQVIDLEQVRGELSRLVSDMAWKGPNAVHFQEDWRVRNDVALRKVANALREQQQTLTQQAHDQQETSKGDGGSTGIGGKVADSVTKVASWGSKLHSFAIEGEKLAPLAKPVLKAMGSQFKAAQHMGKVTAGVDVAALGLAVYSAWENPGIGQFLDVGAGVANVAQDLGGMGRAFAPIGFVSHSIDGVHHALQLAELHEQGKYGQEAWAAVNIILDGVQAVGPFCGPWGMAAYGAAALIQGGGNLFQTWMGWDK